MSSAPASRAISISFSSVVLPAEMVMLPLGLNM